MLHQHKVKVIFLVVRKPFYFYWETQTHLQHTYENKHATKIALVLSLQYKMFPSVGLTLSLQCKY